MRSARAIGGAGLTAFALVFGGIAYAAFYDGTSGDDTIVVERSSGHAYLKGGNDTFRGAQGDNGGADYVRGGPGNDTIRTFTRPDQLRGGRGSDFLDAGAHKDILFGGPGDDTLVGGPGVDQFQPGRGNDICFGQLEDINFPGECEDARVVEP